MTGTTKFNAINYNYLYALVNRKLMYKHAKSFNRQNSPLASLLKVVSEQQTFVQLDYLFVN